MRHPFKAIQFGLVGSVTRVTLRENHFRSRETARKLVCSFWPPCYRHPRIHGFCLEPSLRRAQFHLALLVARPLGRFAIVAGYHRNSLAFIHVGPHRG